MRWKLAVLCLSALLMEFLVTSFCKLSQEIMIALYSLEQRAGQKHFLPQHGVAALGGLIVGQIIQEKALRQTVQEGDSPYAQAVIRRVKRAPSTFCVLSGCT